LLTYLLIGCCSCVCVDLKSYALSVRDFVEVTREVTIKHYRIFKSTNDSTVYIAKRSMFPDLLLLVQHYQGTPPSACHLRQGANVFLGVCLSVCLSVSSQCAVPELWRRRQSRLFLPSFSHHLNEVQRSKPSRALQPPKHGTSLPPPSSLTLDSSCQCSFF